MIIPSTGLVPDHSTSKLLRRHDFDHNATPMWVFDAKSFAFLAVNDAAVYSYGYSRREFLAMTILDIRPGKDIVPLVRRQLKGPVQPSVREIWTHERKDHSLLEVEITSHAILFNGRPAEVVIAAPAASTRRLHALDLSNVDHLCV